MVLNIYTVLAITIYCMVMLGIGLLAFRTANSNINGFLLGGRQVGPATTALSAGASDMSGWMLMGLPGAMYLGGFDTLWIALGLITGAWMNYIVIAPRLRVMTEMYDDALTVPTFLGRRFPDKQLSLQLIAGATTLVFFTFYTASGLVAGGKLFEAMFGTSFALGAFITASIVVAYTFVGGFLAVSVTDFVQGVIMFIALLMIPIAATLSFDGVGEVNSIALSQIPSLSESLSSVTALGLISALAWGLGYFGQPHIIVRFMAIRSVSEIPKARRIGMFWMTVTLTGALLTGFVGVAYVTKFGTGLTDPETIFIHLAQVLFHPLIGGFLLAAVLAAIMSTISSQLLVSSSALTEDIAKAIPSMSFNSRTELLVGRLGVIAVAVAALLLSLASADNVLTMVSHAWAGFGAAFGPLMIASLCWPKTTGTAAISSMLSGGTVVIAWIYGPFTIGGVATQDVIYAMVPGFLVSTIILVVVSKLTFNAAALSRANDSIDLLKQQIKTA